MSTSAAPSLRGGILRVVVGSLLTATAFASIFGAAKLGLAPDDLNTVRSIIPMMILVGIAVSGTGIHQVLWAPPRDTTTIPSSSRPFISAGVTVFWTVLTSAFAGVVAAFIRR